MDEKDRHIDLRRLLFAFAVDDLLVGGQFDLNVEALIVQIQ
jgi:hypothetical protein